MSAKENLFSATVKGVSRHYFLEIRETVDEAKYLLITEVKRDGHVSQTGGHILVFEEQIPSFLYGLEKVREYFLQNRPKSYNVAFIRRRYPRACAKWSESEDAQLKQAHKQAVRELAKLLQRRPGSIRSRLRKLDLLGE